MRYSSRKYQHNVFQVKARPWFFFNFGLRNVSYDFTCFINVPRSHLHSRVCKMLHSDVCSSAGGYNFPIKGLKIHSWADENYFINWSRVAAILLIILASNYVLNSYVWYRCWQSWALSMNIINTTTFTITDFFTFLEFDSCAAWNIPSVIVL